MEERPLHPVGILRYFRDVPPADYIFSIESFSMLLKTKIVNLESAVFESGGYKWKLSLYPSGNLKRNGRDHVSLYLAMVDHKSLPLGWEVNVDLKMFVFDKKLDKYLTVQDGDAGTVKRFHSMKTEWGFDQLISLDTFRNPSNGYLVDDSCVFGVEIFVVKYSGKGESLSIVNAPKNNTYTWKIAKFSHLAADKIYVFSEEFNVAERKWKLLLYPKGDSRTNDKHMSLYLSLSDSASLPPGRQLYVEYELTIKNQLNNHDDHESRGKKWFSASSSNSGASKFFPLSDLKDPSKGFMVNDVVIVEGHISLITVIKDV